MRAISSPYIIRGVEVAVMGSMILHDAGKEGVRGARATLKVTVPKDLITGEGFGSEFHNWI